MTKPKKPRKPRKTAWELREEEIAKMLEPDEELDKFPGIDFTKDPIFQSDTLIAAPASFFEERMGQQQPKPTDEKEKEEVFNNGQR